MTGQRHRPAEGRLRPEGRRRGVEDEGSRVIVYGTAAHPGVQVGGVLFAGSGRVRCLDVVCGADRRRWVEELMRNDSTFEFSSVYRPAEKLSSDGVGGHGGLSGRRSACFPGLSHAAGTSGGPANSGSLPSDRRGSPAPGVRGPRHGRPGSRICVRVCVRNSAKRMRRCATRATWWTGGSALTCVFETVCHC